MNRIPYLEPLVNHLKASTILNGHAIPGVPDINGQNIFVLSEYDMLTEINNFFYGVLIHPMNSSPEDIKDCGTILTHKFLIGAMVRNARNVRLHFQESVSGGVTSYTGAYPQAAEFERLIREAILEFNATIQDDGDFQKLELVELMEPDEHNGLMIMGSVYQTRYVF